MNCQEFEDILITQIYGNPDPSRMNDLLSHVKTCPTCAKQYEKIIHTRNQFQRKDDVTIPEWEKSWKVILKGVMKRKRAHLKYVTTPRLAFAGTALIAVFIIGFFAGRQIFLSKSEESMTGVSWIDSRHFTLDTYAERLDVVLINFMNRHNKTDGEEVTEFEKKVIDDMLVQTRLLKNFHSQKKDSQLMILLNEIECILISISNLRSEDLESAEQLDQLIRQKAFNYKLKQMSENQAVS